MNDADWREALQLRIMFAGETAHSISLAAGLGPTAVRDILSGRSKRPRYQTLYRIAQALGCTTDELLSPPADFGEITAMQTGKRGHKRVGDDERSALDVPPEAALKQKRGAPQFIPIIDLEALADELPEERWTTGEMALPRQLLADLSVGEPAALIVRDDAMHPTINRGDLLIIDRTIRRPRRDGIFVLQRPGLISTRRIAFDPVYETMSILADNTRYPPVTNVSLKDVRVLGMVVWHGRRL